MNCFAQRPLVRGFAILALIATCSLARTPAADLYWDANGNADGTGGTGTWTTINTWRNGSSAGALQSWADGNSAYFEGTAGVVTLESNVAPVTTYFNVTGYTLQPNNTTARALSGNFELADGVELNLNASSATSNRTLSIGGSISGGTSITIQGSQTASTSSRVNLNAANANISTNIVINQAGPGIAGVVATAANTQITGTITNNSSGRTMIGATSGNDLTLASSAAISGSAGVQFSAANSGGAGIVTLNSQSTYTGATFLNADNSGIVRLGVNNALSTVTDVTFGINTTRGGILDLNGFNQEIASLVSGASASGSIRNNASGTTSTLTISGSSTSGAYDLAIVDNTSGTGKVALTRAGTGTLTLSNVNSYTGATTITGGTLRLEASGSIANSESITVGVDNTSSSAVFDVVDVPGGFELESGQLLRGTGLVDGTIGVNAGATLGAGGTTNPGVLTVSNDVTFHGTALSTFLARLNGSVVGDGSSTDGYDRLTLTFGTLALNNADLELEIGTNEVKLTDRYFIVWNEAGVTLTGGFTGLSDGQIFQAGGFSWQIFYGASADAYGGTNGNDVVLVPVPEPTLLLPFGLGVYGVLAGIRRFRKRHAANTKLVAN